MINIICFSSLLPLRRPLQANNFIRILIIVIALFTVCESSTGKITNLLTVLFACGFLLLAGYETWDYYARYSEDHSTGGLF